MEKKSYGHFCPIAYSLDLLGDRWTLLILREMLYGARRFVDLQRGLAGIPSNLLAKRLKELEDACLIEQRPLPPPYATHVYQLTEYGLSTRKTIGAHVRWGLQFLTAERLQADFVGSIQAMGAVDIYFDPTAAQQLELCVEIRFPHDTFSVNLANADLTITQGTAQQPQLIIATPPKTLVRLVMGFSTPQQALDEYEMRLIKGDLALLQQFAALFKVQLITLPQPR